MIHIAKKTWIKVNEVYIYHIDKVSDQFSTKFCKYNKIIFIIIDNTILINVSKLISTTYIKCLSPNN